VQSLPAVALGSLTGVFVDRWDRRHTMIVADLARAVLILLLLTVRARTAEVLIEDAILKRLV